MRIFKLRLFVVCGLWLTIIDFGFCGEKKTAKKKNWDVYKSTFAFCPFSLEYPSELDKPEEIYGPGKNNSTGFIHADTWEPEIMDKENHPIKLYLDVAIYKKPNKIWDDSLLFPLVPSPCSTKFPFEEKYSTSTTTSSQGFTVEEYRDCDGVIGWHVRGGDESNEGEFPSFPHEILVRLMDLPTCTVKLTAEMPIIFEKDYYKKDEYLPAKDTAKLKKKKKDIRNKLLTTLNSFKYLDPATKPKKQSP